MLNGNRTIPESFLGTAFKASEIFDEMTPAAATFLASIRTRKLFGSECAVNEVGSVPDGILVLAEGGARLDDGAGRPIREIGAGEIIGLTEVIADLPSELGVTTVTPCMFEFVATDDFNLFLRSEPEICFRLLKTLGANLQYIYRILAN